MSYWCSATCSWAEASHSRNTQEQKVNKRCLAWLLRPFIFFNLSIPAVLLLSHRQSGALAVQDGVVAEMCAVDTPKIHSREGWGSMSYRKAETEEQYQCPCSQADLLPAKQQCVHIAMLRHLPNGLFSGHQHDTWQMEKEQKKWEEAGFCI